VLGSVKELEELSGKKVKDLHKHFMDKITFKCHECDSTMKRIPDVLDCWFESGSMPFSQLHYPFENEKKFNENFPAEFISEAVDQTRTWFYYLHVIAAGIKKKPAFKNVVVGGMVLAEDGLKMSKRLQNYPDPMDMFQKYGADAVRYYLSSSPVMRAEDFKFIEKEVDEVVKKVILILNNVLTFYEMYANDKVKASNKSKNILDEWIIAKTNQLISDTTRAYDNYDLNRATRPIVEFINELSTWYLRRSRDRFKREDAKDKQKALETLRWVLEQLSLVMAPVMPFTAERVWHRCVNLESVHLQDWPKTEKVDESNLTEMDKVRSIVELGLSSRAESGIKIRQPLQTVMVKGAELKKTHQQLVLDELNVKLIKYNKGDDLEVELDTKITSELQIEGNLRELVRSINSMRKKAGLTMGDKITLTYHTNSNELKKVFDQFSDELKKSVIASKLVEGKNKGEYLDVNGEKIAITIKK
jgi:isoleucyl-tRNA synthetase